MKKIAYAALIAALVLSLAACGGGGGLPEGERTFGAEHRGEHKAEFAMDGDLTTGWVGKRKASVDNPQRFDIDFGKSVTFSRVTIDDTFASGYTNRKPDYVAVKPRLRYINATSTPEKGTYGPANVLSGATNNAADGQSWQSVGVPSADAPQRLYLSFVESISVKKITFDNDMNGSALACFKVYSHASEQLQSLDPADYTLLFEVSDNQEKIYEKVFDEQVTVRSILLEITEQIKEGAPVEASLDEILFAQNAPDDYSESHQPVRFHLMGSTDGDTYTVFAEENGNYEDIWTKELEAPVTYRFVRYLLFEEGGNNYPSLGEIIFE